MVALNLFNRLFLKKKLYLVKFSMVSTLSKNIDLNEKKRKDKFQ